MRIAPRTMLCGITFESTKTLRGTQLEELREFCTATGDKASLAVGMAHLVVDHTYHDRVGEASQLASETWASSVGRRSDPLGGAVLRTDVRPGLEAAR